MISNSPTTPPLLKGLSSLFGIPPRARTPHPYLSSTGSSIGVHSRARPHFILQDREHLTIVFSNGFNHRLYGRHEHGGLQQYLWFGHRHSVRDLIVPVCGCGTSVLHTPGKRHFRTESRATMESNYIICADQIFEACSSPSIEARRYQMVGR